MKKNLFFVALAALALASCSDDTFVGENSPNFDSMGITNGDGGIHFGSGFKAVTRADHVGADAASMLNQHFTVAGFKGAGDVTATVVATGTVFDNYIVQWTENTAATTKSNTSDWEYAGITAVAPSTIAGNKQSIKYWDYSAAQYDFIAYSTGASTAIATGTPTTGQVLVSAVSAPSAKTAAYTLQGAAADLKECYIADMVTAYKDGTDATHKYQDEVQLTFRALASKVRMAIYETVPGYSIKDVKFYTDATTTLAVGASSSDATLFTTASTAKDNFYTAGTYTVKFPTVGKGNIGDSDYNKAHVSFVADVSGKESTKTFGTLNLVGRDYKEADATNYIGRSSTTPSFAGTASPDNYYTIAMPNEEGTVLELRVDYTLLSIDGSGEEIKVHGATAFVPAIYAAWKPNYAYTYIFKISDNSNGWTSTSTSDPKGLYPITFDAVVVDSEENTQSTITTVATPSITTYQKGHVYSEIEEYKPGDIYVQVMTDGTLNNDLGTKGQLYTLSRAATEAEVMDALNIQAASDASTITGRNGLVLTKVSSDATITTVPGADGNDITVTAGSAAKFAATANNYAYVYNTGTDEANTDFHTAVVLTAEPTGWPTGYYTDEACTVPATTYSDGTYYQKYTNLNVVYGVKVIKVVAAP